MASILLVDTDRMARTLVRIVLEGHGHRVVPACNGKHAIEASRHLRGKIDLLIAAITMSEVTGAELAHYLRIWQPAMRVILMHGVHQQRFPVPEGWELLQKPFTARVILDRVRQVADL